MRFETKIILIISLILVLSSSVTALGVGPVYTNLEFEPNFEKEYTFSIYNDENDAFKAIIKIEGELASYISINTTEEIFEETDSNKKVKLSLNLPRDMVPGKYNSEITITRNMAPKGMIGLQTIVSHKLKLTVPAHGKYISEDIVEGKDNISLEITNIGLKTITQVNFINTIYDEENKWVQENSITEFVSDEIFTILIPKEQSPGIYTHELYIKYDELEKNNSFKITIGELKVEILDSKLENSKLNEINELKTELIADWNQELKNLRIEGILKQNGKIVELMSDIKTNEFDFYKQTIQSIYLNAEKLAKGEYDLELTVFQGENILGSNTFTVVLKEEEITIKQKSNLITIILIPIILIILAAFIYIESKKIIAKKKKSIREKHQKEQEELNRKTKESKKKVKNKKNKKTSKEKIVIKKKKNDKSKIKKVNTKKTLKQAKNKPISKNIKTSRKAGSRIKKKPSKNIINKKTIAINKQKKQRTPKKTRR